MNCLGVVESLALKRLKKLDAVIIEEAYLIGCHTLRYLDFCLKRAKGNVKNFGNIDVDWQLQLDMTVNQYVKANIGTHLVYDDDIKSKEEENGVQVTKGPKVQLKQLLGVGVVYQF